MNQTSKHIHFIGICGVAMSALAIAFKKAGWQVTGSDAGFFPPISTNLEKQGVDFYPGWHPDRMVKRGIPDLIVVGNVAGSTNPEWLYVKKNGLNYKSYPEVIAEYLVAPNSIVCAGTYGKTTSAALMTWILKENGFDPRYMFGGLSLNGIDAAGMTESSYSVLEGDEYKTSRSDSRPKFAHYSPTHLLLTSVVWDHADVYPTEERYVHAFQQLYDMMPKKGVRVISEKAKKVIHTKEGSLMSYGQDFSNNYQYADIQQSKTGVAFDIIHEDKTYHIQTSTLGEFMADNMTGCFALAHQIGIEPNDIITAMQSFKGIKRRLEKRYEGNITVFDDIAHSPSKAEAILHSLRSIYSGKIIAIFEPNTGNRKHAAMPAYDHAFAGADEVIIPRLTKIKVDTLDQDLPFDGAELAAIIQKTHSRVHHIDDDQALIKHIIESTKKDDLSSVALAKEDVVVFLGSHGFRGMIEELVTSLHPSPLPSPHHPEYQ